MPDDPVVVEMPRASVLEDGSLAELHFRNSDSTVQVLRFSPTTFLGFVNRAFELFLNEQMKRAEARGHFEIQPLPVSVTAAKESVGGQVVILSVRLQTGLMASFAIQPPEAEELHRQLGKAVKKARRDHSSSRH